MESRVKSIALDSDVAYASVSVLYPDDDAKMNKLKQALHGVFTMEGLEQQFRAFDTDGDGDIDHEEFRVGLRSLGAQITDEEVDGLIKMLDRKGTGTIDYQVFGSFTESADMLAAQQIRELLALREKYMGGTLQPDIEDSSLPAGISVHGIKPSGHTFAFVKGVVRVATADGKSIGACPSFEEFVSDMNKIEDTIRRTPVKSLSKRRLVVLQRRYDAFSTLNSSLEKAALDEHMGEHSFGTVHKVDTHVHLAAAMSSEHLLEFVRKKLEENGDEEVMLDKDKNPVMLKTIFEKLELTAEELSVQSMDTQIESNSAFKRFDRFNTKYDLFKSSDLRYIFLKKNNLQNGKYLGELTADLFKRLKAKEYTKTEYRISVYGRSLYGWDEIAKWAASYKLYSPYNRWIVQIPRLYNEIKGPAGLRSFGELISNIFMPIFAVTEDPASNPALHSFLLSVSGFDSVDDESQPDADLLVSQADPDQWTSADPPPYEYWIYFLYANIFSLNVMRKERGLNQFALRPHCGEAGRVAHLSSAFLLAHNINHGINLKDRDVISDNGGVVLQYMYYLTQIPIAMSQLSNDELFLELAKNPFPTFLHRGLNVSLSTDDPLIFHSSDDPLEEEYFSAAQHYDMTEAEMCEVARNSVLQSGFSDKQKRMWLCGDACTAQERNMCNDQDLTLVTDIRLQYRSNTLDAEWEFIQSLSHADEPITTLRRELSLARMKVIPFSRLETAYPGILAKYDCFAGFMFNDLVKRRTKYRSSASSKVNLSRSNLKRAKAVMVSGVLRITYREDPIAFPPSIYEFSDDYVHMNDCLGADAASSFATRRTEFLEQSFDLHRILNMDREKFEVRSVKKDFYTLAKVNSGSLRTMMSQRMLDTFMHEEVGNNRETVQMYDGSEITVERLFALFEGSHEKGGTYETSMIVATAILHHENDVASALFGRLVAKMVEEEEAQGHIIELSLPIIGFEEDEWDILADWVDQHGFMRDSVRFRITMMFSSYPEVRQFESVKNFEEYLLNIFWPLFLVAREALAGPALDKLLKMTTSLDLHTQRGGSADESEPDVAKQLNWFKVQPIKWVSKELPPLEYVSYFVFSNLKVLNDYRSLKQLKKMCFQPYVSSGMFGTAKQLQIAFFLGDQIQSGRAIDADPRIQYLYYLSQIGVACSPVGERAAYANYGDHPFGKFFKRGLNVMLRSTDGAGRRLSRHPLLDEFFLAKRTWSLETIDLSEIACNTIRTSAFEDDFKRNILGGSYTPGHRGNDPSRSSIPNIR